MVIRESEEYIHKETNYIANVIELKNNIVGFIYFDDDGDFQSGEMLVEDFKNDFEKVC